MDSSTSLTIFTPKASNSESIAMLELILVEDRLALSGMRKKTPLIMQSGELTTSNMITAIAKVSRHYTDILPCLKLWLTQNGISSSLFVTGVETV